MDAMSYKSRAGASTKTSHFGDNVTISEYGNYKVSSKRRSKASKLSQGHYEGMQGGVPNLRKRKIRPYSAPRHQGQFQKASYQSMGPQIIMSQ